MHRPGLFARIGLLAMLLAGVAILATGPSRWIAAQDEPAVTGDYAVTIGSNDVPTNLPNGSVLVGRWQVSFNGDGTYFADRLDLGRVVEGAYEIEGETMTVTDTSGLISCANPSAQIGDQGDVSTGTYTFEVAEDLLILTPLEDNCATRRVLLGTRDFGQFVACLTGATVASPVAEATPIDEELADDEGSDPGQDILDILTPPAGDDEDQPESDDDTGDADVEQVAAEIDALLAQMTACWQTQDADKFLPLLTEEWQDLFLGSAPEEEQRAQLEQLMVQPLVWERAGEVELDGEDDASVVVRLAIAGQEQFGTYLFVREDGVWKWAGQEA